MKRKLRRTRGPLHFDLGPYHSCAPTSGSKYTPSVRNFSPRIYLESKTFNGLHIDRFGCFLGKLKCKEGLHVAQIWNLRLIWLLEISTGNIFQVGRIIGVWKKLILMCSKTLWNESWDVGEVLCTLIWVHITHARHQRLKIDIKCWKFLTQNLFGVWNLQWTPGWPISVSLQ